MHGMDIATQLADVLKRLRAAEIKRMRQTTEALAALRFEPLAESFGKMATAMRDFERRNRSRGYRFPL